MLPDGRLLRVAWSAAIVSSFLSCLVSALSALTPLLVYEGWTLSGWVSLASSNLRAFGEPAWIPPLESVARITVVLAAISISSLALAAASVLLWVLGRFRTSLEAATASAVATALSTTLLYSTLRVVVWDIVPQLDSTRSVYSTAGRLLLNPPKVVRSPVLEAYARHGTLLVIWGAVSLGLAVALYCYGQRLRAAVVSLNSEGLPGEEFHDIKS